MARTKWGVVLLGWASLATAAEPLVSGHTANFSLSADENRQFTIDVGPRKYLRIEVQGDRATVICSLRRNGVLVASAGGFGGTGGRAAIAAVTDDEPAQFDLEVRRGGKEPEAHAVSATLAIRDASGVDRAEAAAYRALAGAKTAVELDVARLLAIQADRPELSAYVAAAEERALFGAGKYQECVDLAKHARPNANGRLAGQILYGAGLCELLLEKNKEAAQLFSEAVPLQREADQPYELAATLQNLSAAHMVLGACRDSLTEAEEALRIRKGLGDPTREAYSMLGSAKAHICLGEQQAALDAYADLIPLWRQLKDPRNEAASYNDLGTLYSSLGAWDEATVAYRNALRLREAAHDAAGQSESLVNLGQLQVLTREYAKALPDYDRALGIPREHPDRRMEGYALDGRAEALYRLGRRPEALADLRKSIEALQQVGDKSGEAHAWWMLGQVESSAQDFERALSLAREVGDRPSEAIYLNDLARLEASRGQAGPAAAALEQAIAIVETARADLTNPSLRMSYLSTIRDAYEQYVDVLTRSEGHTELAAFQASERGHARVLLDELGLDHSPAQKTVDIEEIRSGALDPNTILIEYLLGEQRSWLWFVSQDRFDRVELPRRAEIENTVRRFYTALTARNVHDPHETPEQRAARWKQADDRQAAAALQLRQILLGPVWNKLGARRVLLVSDGLLQQVPFAALGIRGELVLIPSASVMIEVRRVPIAKTARTMLLVADPEFGPDSGFAKLPHTRSEANGIAALLPRGAAEERLGAEASAAALRAAAAQYSTIHIATHTVLNSQQPERSGIVLSSGYLRIRDIYDLHLKTGLVTLSACETALGKDVRGEGMIGLSRAFLYAGARRVVASLWKVEDDATEWFMEAFYRGIYRQGFTPAAALHAAQTDMKRNPQWSAPYYWAAFTIEGDWR